MPRYSVEYKGKWAVFSSIVDAFITVFVDKEELEQWRKEEYGRINYRPIEKRNVKTIQEAVFSIRLNKTREQALECLLESGLPKEDCEQLFYDMETKYYCPKPKDNGRFECPNCHSEVEKNQFECENPTCCLEFVWRT